MEDDKRNLHNIYVNRLSYILYQAFLLGFRGNLDSSVNGEKLLLSVPVNTQKVIKENILDFHTYDWFCVYPESINLEVIRKHVYIRKTRIVFVVYNCKELQYLQSDLEDYTDTYISYIASANNGDLNRRFKLKPTDEGLLKN